MSKNLDELWKVGKEFLGTKYAIMGGAMSWISESNLVSAVSNAGGFGVIASGAMNGELLLQEIKATKSKTNKPFGVNLITINPAIKDLIQVCLDEEVSHVILAGGLPSMEMITFLKSTNKIKVIGFAPNLAIAKRLISNKVDAIIVEGSEAGGHIGPVSTSVLVQEVLLNIKDIPIFVAGGIGRGEIVKSYLELGACGVQVGTLIACAKESIAHENFKKAFFRANSRDAQVTTQIDPKFPVIPVRAITNKGSQEFMEVQKNAIEKFNNGVLDKHEAQLEIEKYWAGALRRAVIDGDVEHGSLMAGQCVGLVKEEKTIADIFSQLIAQAQQ